MSWPVPERREHLTRLYLEGVPYRLIAKEYGGTEQGVRGTIRKMRDREALPYREQPRGGFNRRWEDRA